MAEEVTPLYDIIVQLIGVIVVITILFFILYCNYLGGICPGRWSCNLVFTLIYNSIEESESFVERAIGLAIIGGLRSMCPLLPV